MQNSYNRYFTFSITLIKWVVWGTFIGIFVGSATAFLLHTNDFLGVRRESNEWLIFLLPIGGIIVGAIYHYFGRTSNKGNNLVIEGSEGTAKVLVRMGPIVYIGTFITILFGGSTGREGAAVQMGGSISEALNRLFQINITDRKILLMSGMSCGFGAAFGTPITGAIFGMEVAALGKMKYEGLIPCFVASFVGHYVTAIGWGAKHESFVIKTVPELTGLTAVKVIIVSIIFSLVAVLYSQLRHHIQKTSERLLKNHMLRGFVGGIIIIALVFIVGSTDYNGRGLEMLEQSFHGDVPAYAFLAKLVFTAFTLGMGFVGGEAIPLFFMGATLGNTLSGVLDLPVSFLAGIGMIAAFCAGANVPIASVFLAIEMFDGKGMEYFFIACIISYIFSGHHGLWPSQKIYEPKSRLWQVPAGKTIKAIEKTKTQALKGSQK